MTNSELSRHDASYRSAEIVTDGAGFGSAIMDREAGLSRFGIVSPFKFGGLSGGKTRHAAHVGIGFVPRSNFLHRAYNTAIALLLVGFALPLLLTITALLLITQGRPIFYRGERIGRDGKMFNILKFRTLDSEKAAELTKNSVLKPGSGAETRAGLFLRETRLDELPQLFNVLLGDMNVCGPRPVRPEIMKLYSAEIPNYAARFEVKPGLIGPTQALMYHGTSKAVRSRLNYRFSHSYVSYRAEIALIATVGACVLARTVSRSFSVATAGLDGQRSQAEIVADTYKLKFEDANGVVSPVRWIDMDSIALGGTHAEGRPTEGRITMTLLDGQTRKFDIVIENGVSLVNGGTAGFAYNTKTEFGEHIKSRYLFQKVVVPHRSEFLFARLWAKVSGKAA